MSKHTPGPWHVHANGKSVMNANGNAVVAETTHSPNAALIAQAPALLAICKEIAESKCDLGDSERRIRLYHVLNVLGEL